MAEREAGGVEPAGVKSFIVWSMPAIFVVLWATGFIFADIGVRYTGPLTLLTMRFAIVIAALLPIVYLARAPWPKTWAAVGHIAVAGLLIQATYLGGVFVAIDRNMPPGVTALIVSAQPIVAALLVGPLLGERLSFRQWVGIVLGFAGVAVVLVFRFSPTDPVNIFHDFGWGAVVLALVSLFGITIGVLYQKRFCPVYDLRTGTIIQFTAALAVMAVLAKSFETNEVDWSWTLVGVLAWLSIVMSIGAIMLLGLVIRMGEAAKTASLFYLVPPMTAVMAFLFLGHELGVTILAGIALTAVGVALVMNGKK